MGILIELLLNRLNVGLLSKQSLLSLCFNLIQHQVQFELINFAWIFVDLFLEIQ